MIRVALVIAALGFALSFPASAQLLTTGYGPGSFGGGGPPLTSGAILLVNGSNFLLQTDGSSHVCTAAGGC